jgi:uncharacterized membrane protein YccC
MLRSYSKQLGAWMRDHRAQLRLSLRVTVSALAALALAQYFQLALPLWAVLTAVIVTQMSVGRSLKATLDYLVGTLGGAIYGGVLGVLVPHESEIALLAVLAIAVAPLALIATMEPRLNVAPVTAIIVLLVPTITHASQIGSAIDRVLEVALGGVTGLIVSFFLLPSNAYALAIEAAADTLDRLAEALNQLLAGLTEGLDVDALHRIQDGIGLALAHLSGVGGEAERERAARLVMSPDTGPLRRTLLRLRHDVVMIGRAAAVPLPEALRGRLEAPLQRIAEAIGDYMHASAAALRARRDPPAFDPVESALDAFMAEITALRHEGLTRGLPSEDAERFFALGFAFEQMRPNFRDLERCVAEWAHSPERAGLSRAGQATG